MDSEHIPVGLPVIRAVFFGVEATAKDQAGTVSKIR